MLQYGEQTFLFAAIPSEIKTMLCAGMPQFETIYRCDISSRKDEAGGVATVKGAVTREF